MNLKLSDQDNKHLIASFYLITDPRDPESCTYSLHSILFIVLAGTISGMKGWDALHEFAIFRRDWICNFVQLPETVPSADTLRRVFELICKTEFEKMFNHWLSKLCKKEQGDTIHIDGKAVKSMYDHTGGEPFLYYLHVYSGKNKILLFHKKISGSQKESASTKEILSKLEITNSTITGDANFCTKDIAKAIDEKNNKYYLSLKGNRSDLYGDVENNFKEIKNELIESKYKEEMNGHGRKEIREVIVAKAGNEINNKENWSGLKAIIIVNRERIIKNESQKQQSYYISNEIKDASIVYERIKDHWLIENEVHWKLDVIFEEDESRVRNKTSAANLSVVRKAALSLLQKETSLKKGTSTASKQRICVLSEDYLEKVMAPILGGFK